jgi:gluconate 5-dehydrogenase
MMKLEELFSLKGKVALVTGGGRGIGKFISTGLAEAGADLIITSRKMNNLEASAEELSKAGNVQVFPVACDISKEEDLGNMLKTAVQKFPRIDILVNNAGATWGAPTLSYPLEKWDYVFNVNVRSVWILTQKMANLMKDWGGGTIINIASTAGLRGTEEVAHPAVPYNSTKAAVISLTQNLAVKLAPYHIRVNAIAPGYFRTDMMAHVTRNEEIYKMATSRIPLGKGGDIDDMKGVAVFLASAASQFITGQTIVVDGGSVAK